MEHCKEGGRELFFVGLEGMMDGRAAGLAYARTKDSRRPPAASADTLERREDEGLPATSICFLPRGHTRGRCCLSFFEAIVLVYSNRRGGEKASCEQGANRRVLTQGRRLFAP